MNDLKDVHEESTKPQSIEEQAINIDLTLSKKEIAENTRPVLVQLLRINGIDHETLNISKSKFNKLNRLELVDALFNKPEQEAKQEAKEGGEVTADFLNKILELKEIITEANTSGDYKKLDSVVATNLLEIVSKDETINNIDFKSPHFTKLLLICGSVYFVARLYGFKKIAIKFKELLVKIKGKKSDKVSKNEK